MQKKLITLALLAAVSLLVGCAEVQRFANKGFNLAATVGTNTVGLLDFSKPLVPDPTQPNDPTAVVVNPAIVSAAQTAATTFGGPYGVPISATLGVVAGVAGMWLTASRRRKAAKP